MRRWIFFAALPLLAACGSSAEMTKEDSVALVDSVNAATAAQDSSAHEKPTPQPNASDNSNALGWTIFGKYPEGDKSGCGCNFWEQDDPRTAENLFFSIDFDGHAFVSIKGKETKLNVVQTNREKQSFPGDTLHEIYSNGKFRLELDLIYKKSVGDEVQLYKGKATLSSEGKEVETGVTSECGC